MPESHRFGVFDPAAEVTKTSRYLPHWFQPGAAIFITFRTADSLPAKVLDLWDREQVDWLERNVPGLTSSAAQAALNFTTAELIKIIPESARDAFQQLRRRSWNHHLDDCHGECLLRRSELAGIVRDSVRHFDGQRYDLDSLVVMPNHVHVLAQFMPGNEPKKQCGEWQRYSARKINAILRRRGRFWQTEAFDHLVRSPEQFEYLQRYIAENPQKANLPLGSFVYWRST